MLLDAETRRRGETRGEHLFRIGFRACKATEESQNLRARRQRRSYGFAARLTLGWKADQRSARRIPQRGLVHRKALEGILRAESASATEKNRDWPLLPTLGPMWANPPGSVGDTSSDCRRVQTSLYLTAKLPTCFRTRRRSTPGCDVW